METEAVASRIATSDERHPRAASQPLAQSTKFSIISEWKIEGAPEVTIETSEPSAPYWLSEAFLGGQNFEISADQHAMFEEATTTLVSAMEIEEVFQIFAQSFLRGTSKNCSGRAAGIESIGHEAAGV
ncbi:MAG: hypothetical protein ACU0AX_00475 [Roseovarius sp.]|uniref:hypothetical protein n=1 Tax=Roseovarius sp. TaxID=1486281 RepID=UPI004059AD90